jgi:hypothetical protein
VLVDQQAHELGHRDGRMRVVELDCDVIGQGLERELLRAMAAQEVLQRSRREEEFLAQAQVLSCRRLVARIQDTRDGFQAHAIGQRPTWSAAIEVDERHGIRSRARTTAAGC